MKPRKSTAILIAVWVATFVLYLFVKPTTVTQAGYSPIANIVTKSVVTPTPGR
ncbi:hypothetical protein [Nocardia transvalensis]|uniref:hypothetical protein n=1 Tax=Nocardia transvalensis TaxID=37333 RepID=UPI00189470BB|nr:hypothetical protein [Nocardia transvalensis]MBF6326968.1 hypothetical protein [Nocardia transvalensis]